MAHFRGYVSFGEGSILLFCVHRRILRAVVFQNSFIEPIGRNIRAKCSSRSMANGRFGSQWSLNYLSNEKNPGWLGYIEDYTTQLYRDMNKPL